MARKRDDTIKLVLRLPSQLHRRLTHEAKQHKRSLNIEMVERLDRSFVYDTIRHLARGIAIDPLPQEEVVTLMITDEIKKVFQNVSRRVAEMHLVGKIKSKSKEDEK